MSYVKPIFKQGDSSLTSNYRSISLTSTCCKVMETVIHDQLISCLRTHNLISNNHPGFLARKSTGTNLLNCFQDWQTGASFQLFLGGQKSFLLFNATGLLKNWKKQHFKCSNLTLFIVPFFLFSLFFSFFFFSFFFSFFFFLGATPPSLPQMTPLLANCN